MLTSALLFKFLDAQRIHNLVTYLQDLHSLGLANSEHTTLLLNTYTKLKDVARLDSFIKMESKPTSDAIVLAGSDGRRDRHIDGTRPKVKVSGNCIGTLAGAG